MNNSFNFNSLNSSDQTCCMATASANNVSKNSGMTLMVIATSLCNRYDEWKNDEKLMRTVDVNTNSICIGLKQMYSLIDDKVVQSIALAFTMYFYLLIENGLNNLSDSLNDGLTKEMMDLSVD